MMHFQTYKWLKTIFVLKGPDLSVQGTQFTLLPESQYKQQHCVFKFLTHVIWGNIYQMRYWISKLCVELIDKTLDQPVAVNRIVYNLLHGSTDGEEVIIFFIL